MTTRLVVVSTAFGLATAVAALESGLLARHDRQVLVVTCNVDLPEAAPPMDSLAGLSDLYSRFDAVFDYNAAIEPHHPMAWNPRTGDLPLWERHFRTLWDLGEDDLQLAVQTPWVNPALAVCRIFADARIDVYADGVMSYGPTRSALPELVAHRIEQLVHLDLAPGLVPVLLSEWGVPAYPIDSAAFRAVLKAMAGYDDPEALEAGSVVVVGQYLAALDLLSEREELDLYASMIQRCVNAGYQQLVFKPHPSAPPGQAALLQARARTYGVHLAVSQDATLVETWFEHGRVAMVVGCFSTALLSAQSLYGVPAARLGTELLLERLTPYQNSNRIPVTLIDALVGELPDGRPELPAGRTQPDDLSDLVTAVSYVMQPDLLADRREQVAAYLAQHHGRRARYFKRRRLTKLDLPGQLPAGAPLRRLQQLAGRLRRSASVRTTTAHLSPAGSEPGGRGVRSYRRAKGRRG